MMLCSKPFMAGAIAFGCGQCLNCRISRARMWKYRLILEGLTHEHKCFVTLTYDPKHIRGDWSLDRRHLQLFFKRLRKAISPAPLRYYAVGEYGTKNSRPHYHLCLFGVSEYCKFGDKWFVDCARGRSLREGIAVSGLLFDCWRLGDIHVGELNDASMGYSTGYITKHLQDRKEQKDWNCPEFAVMSNRPGIGVYAIRIIGAALSGRRDHALRGRDVPTELRYGGRKFPLGRYLLGKLRAECGFAPDYSKKFRDEVSAEVSSEVQSVFLRDETIQTFRQAYLAASQNARLSREARYKIFNSRRSL